MVVNCEVVGDDSGDGSGGGGGGGGGKGKWYVCSAVHAREIRGHGRGLASWTSVRYAREDMQLPSPLFALWYARSPPQLVRLPIRVRVISCRDVTTQVKSYAALGSALGAVPPRVSDIVDRGQSRFLQGL